MNGVQSFCGKIGISKAVDIVKAYRRLLCVGGRADIDLVDRVHPPRPELRLPQSR